jgi:hypothetical protein
MAFSVTDDGFAVRVVLIEKDWYVAVITVEPGLSTVATPLAMLATAGFEELQETVDVRSSVSLLLSDSVPVALNGTCSGVDVLETIAVGFAGVTATETSDGATVIDTCWLSPAHVAVIVEVPEATPDTKPLLTVA